MFTRHNLKTILLAGLAAIGLNMSVANSVQAQAKSADRYYMLMFASQANPNVARLSHTFAVFVRAPATTDSATEIQTISWMPRTLRIEPLRMHSQAGVNLDLPATLRWAQSVGSSVSMWGPYRIEPSLYEMAAQQARRLNANTIEYQCNDWRSRGQSASSCIHAVSDLDVSQPALQTGTDCGNDASAEVLQHFKRYIMTSNETPNWLTKQLNLDPKDIRFATSARSLTKR